MRATMEFRPNRRFAFPCRELFPFVDRYWSWEGSISETPSLPTLSPGTGKELVFHFAAPFLFSGSDGRMRRVPRTHMVCLREGAVQLAPDGAVDFFAVRFRAGALRYFSPVPPGEFAHPAAPLPCASEAFGGAIRTFSARMAEAANFDRRVTLIEGWLLRRMRERRPRDAAMDRAVSMLYYGAANARVADAARVTGLGMRQFQRDFSATMGVGPKRFVRLARLQRVIRTLFLDPSRDILDAALSGGYYDQPHFIREFKAFTRQTPVSFFRRERTMTHFYNTSRPENRILASANSA